MSVELQEEVRAQVSALCREVEGLLRERDAVLAEMAAACEALGPAWFAGGVTLPDAIRRKCEALEQLAEGSEQLGQSLALAVGRLDVRAEELEDGSVVVPEDAWGDLVEMAGQLLEDGEGE